jgi:hypothetical protein
MQLTDEQKQIVAMWIEEGFKLSEIQSKLATDLKINLTYIETRLLVDDLKLTPKDAPEPVASPAANQEALPEVPSLLDPEKSAAPGGGLSLTVDTLARPGTIVSGSVVFSDGKKAGWYLDQAGRLGVVAEEQGYRPSPEDVQAFQAALDQELAQRGI